MRPTDIKLRRGLANYAWRPRLRSERAAPSSCPCAYAARSCDCSPPELPLVRIAWTWNSVALVLAVALGWLCTGQDISARVNEVHTPARLQEIGTKYAIKIVVSHDPFLVTTRGREIRGEAPSQPQVDAYAPLLAFKLSLYPVQLVQRSRLRCVVLCCNLASSGEIVTGTTDIEHETCFFDVRHLDAFAPFKAEARCREAIHHELFHLIDWRDDGQLDRDDDWVALNPSGFVYGAASSNVYDVPMASLFGDSPRGFRTRYSTKALPEDKAEIFANMMLDLEFVESRVRNLTPLSGVRWNG